MLKAGKIASHCLKGNKKHTKGTKCYILWKNESILTNAGYRCEIKVDMFLDKQIENAQE